MKKALAVLLSLLMVIGSVSCLFTISASAEETNLFENGDFAKSDLTNDTVEGWVFNEGSYSLDVEEGTAANLPAGEDFNFVTFKRDEGAANGITYLYNAFPVKLAKNTDYKISFWVKNNGIKSFKFYLYEPKYISYTGAYSSQDMAYEGQNIYSYNYDNGTTRVARMDINHVITNVTNNNETLRNGASSMASFSNAVFAPDNQDEWVKIEHVFSTGDDDYHVAYVRYAFSVAAQADNTADKSLSIGGIEMIGTARDVTIVPTPASNNYELGTVEPREGAAVVDGEVSFVAKPLGTNKFLGWYKNNKLVSKNKALTYEYVYGDTSEYKAMFEAYGSGIGTSFENHSTGVKLAYGVNSGNQVNGTDVYTINNTASNGEWTLDSHYALDWQSVITTNAKARSGNQSILLNAQWSFVGRNFVGLTKNTDYTLTFYVFMDYTFNNGKTVDRRLSRVFVTPKDTNVAWNNGDLPEGVASGTGTIASNDSRVLCNFNEVHSTGRWEKIEFVFNTGDNTDVTLWLSPTADGTYLDDISLVSNVIEEDDDGQGGTTMNFENLSGWGTSGNGSTQLKGYTGYKEPENYVSIKTNTDPDYVLNGNSSIVLTPQSRWFDYKLEGLKPNTNYALRFSYITNQMKASTGGAQNTILGTYGIFNYAAANAKLGGVKTDNASGYISYVAAANLSSYDADGVGAPDNYSSTGRRITDGGKNGIAEVANTWYDTMLFFNSGNVSDTLAFTILGNCDKTYLDNLELIEMTEETQMQEYFAPALSGKTAKGVYDTENATTTLYENCLETDYEGYITTLINANFAEYATNAYGNNKFATFVKGNTTVNVEYTPATKTILVTEQITDTLPQTEEENSYNDKGYQPLIIQLDHNNASGGGIGLSYIIRLADGSFIIVDGGHMEGYFDNAIRLYNLLRRYTPEGEIKIAAWLFTHCHSDHITGFMSFINRFANEINVEQLIYNFASLQQYINSGNEVGKLTYTGFEVMKGYIKSFIPNAKISTCHSGYKYHIRNAVIDIMFTLEDLFPSVLGTNFTDINNTSTNYKISFTNENVDQTLLITGDSGTNECSAMLKKYAGDELKSTFVQVIHHGIAYGTYELYGKMNPEVALWPASSNRLMNVLYQTQNRYFVNEDSVKEVALSDYGTRVFALPYTAPEGLKGMDKFTLPSDVNELNTLNSFVGVSIRQAGENGKGVEQALRFKFQIPEHIIRANTEDGYTVAEYGMMVATVNEGLEYYYGNSAYTELGSGEKLYKAVAYNKSENKNIVYDYLNYVNMDDGESRLTQYTCALYNIGGTPSGTDYTMYDTTYYVRAYIIFKNANGETKVYYGDTKSASLFAVMKTILESTDTSEQTLSDKAYVKNFLDGKVEGFTADAAAIKEAWLASSARAALYTPAN